MIRASKQAFALLLSMTTPLFSFANPVYQNTSAGSATVNQTATTTTVNQTSQKAILNWKKFNIGIGEKTHFQQPNGGVALNRIDATQGASKVYGHLTATGQIILINAAGIYFGPTAYVNVGGMIASTTGISDENFLNGNYVFDQPSAYPSSIVNEGKIIASKNGLVALLGSNVTNNGYIQAELGSIVLASGNKFTLAFNGDQLINFSVDEATARGKVSNNGVLSANGGKIVMSARSASNVLDNTINMSGVAQANSVSQQNGEIILSADNGRIQVTGQLLAAGTQAGTRGGSIKILGQKIDVSNAIINASGHAGGGSIYLGGYETNLAAHTNAKFINVDQCTWLKAYASHTGDGGSIVLAAEKMFVAGNVLAMANEGNGGSVQLFGKSIDVANGVLISTASKSGNGQIQLGTNPYGDETTTDVEIGFLSKLDASAYGAGNGGSISVNANNIRLNGFLLANGIDSGAIGGNVTLRGSNILLNYGSHILAKGNVNGGTITISPENAENSSINIMPLAHLDVSANASDGAGGLINIGRANHTSISGNLLADATGQNSFGGQILIAGKTININPFATIDASGGVLGGRIILGNNPLVSMNPLSDVINVSHGSQIKANATGSSGQGGGGSITLFAKDTNVNGKVFAYDKSTGGSGGRISVLATDKLKLGSTAYLNATGDSLGGQIFIGGSINGAGIEPHAQFTTVESGSLINASALRAGDGGNVVVWADNTTDFNGVIKATGGSESGDGGFVQVVGVQTLNNNGSIDVSAPNGNPGTISHSP